MHTYNIKNKKNIFVQSLRTKILCQNVFRKGAKLFIALPLCLKNSINVETFRTNILNIFLDKGYYLFSN